MQENIVTKETLKHALQGAGGGGGKYLHCIMIEGTGGTQWENISFSTDGTVEYTQNNQSVSHIYTRIIDDNPDSYDTSAKLLSAIEAMPEMAQYPKGIPCFVARNAWYVGLGVLYKRISTPNTLQMLSGTIDLANAGTTTFELSFNHSITITSSWTITDTVIAL